MTTNHFYSRKGATTNSTTKSTTKSSTSSSLPVLPLLLAASILTALGAVVRSGGIFEGFVSQSREEELQRDRPGTDRHRHHRRRHHRRHNYHYHYHYHSHNPSLVFLDHAPRFERTRYTLDSFVIANGIDLAPFGLGGTEEATVPSSAPRGNHQNNDEKKNKDGNNDENKDENKNSSIPMMQLFSDFDLRHRLKGNETWIELLEYRRDATHPSLSFYVDKVAFKRWLVASSQKNEAQTPGGREPEPIESIRSFVLQYASELRGNGSLNEMETATATATATDDEDSALTEKLAGWIPTDTDYAAKPTHLSCSGGVWLVHNDRATNTTYVGNGKKPMVPYHYYYKHDKHDKHKNDKHESHGQRQNSQSVARTIASDLVSNLHRVQEKCGRTVKESHALRKVRPGIVVEERFAQPFPGTNGNMGNNNDHDNININDHENEKSQLKGGMEFKVFCIWGRAWLTVWRPGMDGVHALFYRNGTSLAFDPPAKKQHKDKDKDKDKAKKDKDKDKDLGEKPESRPPVQLPDWIDWDRIISIGETLGRNKDMFRTDIFVGIPTASLSDNDNDNDNDAIRYVVSETEIHPTPLRGFETVFEEAGRLWLAGYYLLSQHRKLSVVPNTEVPDGFVVGCGGDPAIADARC